MPEPPWSIGDGGIRLRCRVIPRARAAGLSGIRNGELVVRLTSPPVDGKANAALRRLLAEHFQVAASQVQIEQGERSRSKLVRIDGPTALTPELAQLPVG